ncbi:MAG TPA: ester cyclase [Legionella sp.]|nr:ester cyclase [Legionella sp.]
MKHLYALLVLGLYVVINPSHAQKNSEEINKSVVTQFYQKAINDKDFSGAAQYLGPWYIQHNPVAQDGVEGFKQFIAYLKQNYPNAHSDIKRVMAEGDYVILHVHSVREPGTLGNAIIDIFRLEDHKIVEHWDVTQNIPPQSANGNGMF